MLKKACAFRDNGEPCALVPARVTASDYLTITPPFGILAFTSFAASFDATALTRSAVLTSDTSEASIRNTIPALIRRPSPPIADCQRAARRSRRSFQRVNTTRIWIFDRGPEETLRLETRYDNDTAEFVLIIHGMSGGIQAERFKNGVSFQERLEILETQLEAAHWRQQGPVFLHDGWKLT